MLGILVNMEKFSKIKGIAAPMLSSDGNQFSMMINIDTDMIIPKQFLKTIKRTGLGKSLFHEMRYDFEGNEIESFILNKDIYRDSKIILAGNNFGCGSSREHAPWALLDFGIRVIIAPSFADIFYNNCFQNGILPIVVNAEELDRLMSAAGSQLEFNIDLPNQSIQAGNHSINFDIEDHRKERLLQGLDDIGITLGYKEDISSYESNKKTQKPWLFGDL